MTRRSVGVGCMLAALGCGAALWFVSRATVVPMIANGSGPNGVAVTWSGWLALVSSCLGTGGFSVAGIVTALMSWWRPDVPAAGQTLFSEIVELTISFTALMKDKSNRAAQRRFLFALVDAAQLIQGCQTSHDGGVIVIKYSGYADPVSPGMQGVTP